MRDIEDCAQNSFNCSNCPNSQACKKKSTKNTDCILDVLIIGAGAIGCSVARELSKYQLNTAILEKSTDVSQGASKSNSGIIHGGYDDKHGTLKSKLSHRGNQLFGNLENELHFGFRRIGSLVLAFTQQDLHLLNDVLINGEKNGVSGLRIIGQKEVFEMEPHINPNVLGALHCPHTGIASPYEYVIALAENAVSNGAQIYLSHEVMDIIMVSNNSENTTNSDVHFLVRVADGSVFRSKIVINAAGLMADRVAAMVGANSFYITPRKGEYIILNKSQGHFAKHVLFPVPSAAGKGILVSPTYHGNLLLGPTSRGAGEASLTQRQILQLILGSARHSIPDFDSSQAITSYTGLRAKCSKNDFVVEESNIVPGFINVAGIDSPGLTSSPAVALLVSDIVRNSLKRMYGIQVQSDPSFNPIRAPIIIKKTDGFNGRIGDPNPALNLVCRCEKVTEAEIVDAIHRPLGATDIDSVKKRTRAGMGFCQGQFCEPKVAILLSRELHKPVSEIKGHAVGSSILPHRKVTEEDRQLLEELARNSKLYSKL
jgi:glycerol-3-phosphate dehydrogenase